jgi:murein DD-endopeptidase MepM/ murein hydrolase activator NlpD
MNERLFFLAYKLPSLSIGALIIFVSLFLVIFIQGCVTTANLQSSVPNAKQSTVYYSEQPTALGASLDEATHAVGQELVKLASVANGGIHYVGATTATGAKSAAKAAQIALLTIAHAIQAIAEAIGKAIMFVINTVANIVLFIIRLPVNLYGMLTENRVVSAFIAPSENEHGNEVPIIDPNDPALLAAQKALPAIDPATQTSETPASQEIAWPIHGAITTYFGEKGPHYHPTHTGLDISDGKHSPIKAYRAGTVIAAGRDGGLGNRVIVDHGNGVTSVYGHMSAIYAQVGQQVDITSTLGLEGTTGVSTGNHLHFEIRINGQAADPLLFIAGRP